MSFFGYFFLSVCLFVVFFFILISVLFIFHSAYSFNVLRSRHPSHFCQSRNSNSTSQAIRKIWKEANGTWLIDEIPKKNSRNFWGRKNIQSHHFVWIGVTHSFFFFLLSIQMCSIEECVCVSVSVFFPLFYFIGDTNDSSCLSMSAGSKIFLVHQTPCVINVHMSLSHRVVWIK